MTTAAHRLGRDGLIAAVRRFNDAFNRVDLDGAVALFAEDALYSTFEGRERRGRAAIRAELAPQFRGVYGRLTFDELDLYVDVDAAKASLRWRCHHDLRASARRPVDDVRRRAWRALYGRALTWEGMDILHLDRARGLVVAKHTFAKARLPRTRRG
jgi:ketosteroid isomerase-like protein